MNMGPSATQSHTIGLPSWVTRSNLEGGLSADHVPTMVFPQDSIEAELA
jgi:hypothetical protein